MTADLSWLNSLRQAGDSVVIRLNGSNTSARNAAKLRGIDVSINAQPQGQVLVTCLRHVPHENKLRMAARLGLDLARTT